jgi:hypothetical protein
MSARFRQVFQSFAPGRLGFASLFYALVAIGTSAPAWIVRHPPLQDAPFHLATIRVIHDFSNPLYGFERDYDLNLAHTSYLLYYVMGSLLSYLVGVYRANVLLMALCLGGLPLGMRSFLQATGRDPRLCLFTVPLAVNVMFIYGLMPYVFGLTLLFFALAALVRHVREPSLARGMVVAGYGAALFFAHIFAFGLFALAAIAFFPFAKPHRWTAVISAMVPSVGLLCWWLRGSAAGAGATGSLKDSFQALPLAESLRQFPGWSFDIFRDDTDEKWFLILAALAIAGIVLSLGQRELGANTLRPFGVVVLVCFVSFFLLGDHLGEVWLFAQRFPVPALLCSVPFLRIPRGSFELPFVGALCAVGGASTVNVCQHFIDFERLEVGALDEAIEQMDFGKRVCGLIFDKGATNMHHTPFLHAVSYYQAAKGGVSMFGYAHFLHWPFRFKPGKLPPPGTPARLRWEWTPESTPITEIYPYYDYVLVRGSGFAPPQNTYRIKWRSDRWSVWDRIPEGTMP